MPRTFESTYSTALELAVFFLEEGGDEKNRVRVRRRERAQKRKKR